jgi:carotenoid cleavage dioxygenase-like enzyme
MLMSKRASSEPVPKWSRCVAAPGEPFPSTALVVRSGRLPPGLRGTLYRNGPARLERGGIHVGHWFDGDGAVLAVRFRAGGADATYRYIETDGLREEEQAGRLLYGNYGMTAPGPLWNQWRRPLKNTANTSVLALPDRLLALWEGGQPHALDLRTLETLGLDDLDGTLTFGDGPLGQTAYSAHPKRDPVTGEIWNFGGAMRGRYAVLRLYRSDAGGRLRAHAEHRLDGLPLIHDFVLAGRWLVFLVPPVRIRLLPILSGVASFADAMRWRPELGTRVLVFDRDTLNLVARSEIESGYQWHFGNGATDDAGRLVLDHARYADFATNQHLAEIASGRTETFAKATLWRLRLEPQTARVLEYEEVCDRSLEFPVVAAGDGSRCWTRTYVAVHRRGSDPATERYDGIAAFDYPAGRLDEADLGEGRYPSEPIVAADTDYGERRWLLTLVYDGNAHASEIWVFDAERLGDGPACVLGLPKVIPFGFHGCWNPARSG